MSWTEIERARNFVKAGVAMGLVHMDRAIAEGVDVTGHSCYEEGWAAGFQEAFKLVADFIAEEPVDEAKQTEGYVYAYKEKGRNITNSTEFGKWYATSDWTDPAAAYDSLYGA